MHRAILPSHVVRALEGQDVVRREASAAGAEAVDLAQGALLIERLGPFAVWIMDRLAKRAESLAGRRRRTPHTSWVPFPGLDRDLCNGDPAAAGVDQEPLSSSNKLYFLNDVDQEGPFFVQLAGERGINRYHEEAILGRPLRSTLSSKTWEVSLLLAKSAAPTQLEALQARILRLATPAESGGDNPCGFGLHTARARLADDSIVEWKHPELEALDRETDSLLKSLKQQRSPSKIVALNRKVAELGLKRAQLYESDALGPVEIRKPANQREGLRCRLSPPARPERCLWAIAAICATFSETEAPVSLFLISKVP